VGDIAAALTTIQPQRLDALIVPADPTFPNVYRRISEFALGNRLSTMFGHKRAVEAGGFMGYEANPTEMYKRAAVPNDAIGT